MWTEYLSQHNEQAEFRVPAVAEIFRYRVQPGSGVHLAFCNL